MKKLLKFAFVLAIIGLWIQSAAAFPQVNFYTNTELEKEYQTLVQAYENRYTKIKPVSKVQFNQIDFLEERIGKLYGQLARTKSEITKRRLTNSIRVLTKRLNTRVTKIERSKGITASATGTIISPPVATTTTPTVPTGAVNRTPVVLVEPEWSPSATADLLYYAESFEGGKTANGNTFAQAGFSAARCDIPLNTLIQVRYGDKSVVVKANDRPNCTKHPDIVDLTSTAFSTLAPLSKGRLDGSFVSLGTVQNSTVKNYLPEEYFASLNIRLNPSLPNIYEVGETLILSGKTTDNSTESLILVISPSGNEISYGQDSEKGNQFEYHVPLNEPGAYRLVLASGRSFSGAKALTIEVLESSVLEGKQFHTEWVKTPAQVTTSRSEASDLTPTNRVTVSGVPANTKRTITLSQGARKISKSSMGDIAFSPSELRGFRSGSSAQVSITTQASSTPFSMDTYATPVQVLSGSMVLVPLYKTEKNEAFTAVNKNGNIELTLGAWINKKIERTAYIITPSGGVDEVMFDSKYVGSDGYLRDTNGAKFTYTMKETGVYLVEVNYDTGFAAVIHPVNNGDVFAILPNEYDSTTIAIEKSQEAAVANTLASINTMRKSQGLNALTLDTNLSNLAAYKAKDMSDNNYVGHADSQGKFILDTAKRAGIKVTWGIGENVAGGTVGASFLQAGLSLSAAHRSNMIDPRWSRVGIGVVISNGRVSVVELFGE